ncbi:hypothetical protein BH23PLA1_BH23PLA1_43160 [soil metagenome]
MATTSQTPQDADEIRRYMAQIRRELHEDMQNVVLGAAAVTDWQRYIRLYPWLSVGLALTAGFLIVPRRRPSRSEIAEEAAEDAIERTQRTRSTRRRGDGGEVVVEAPAENVRKKSKFGLMGMAFGMLAPVLTRVAQNYASNYLETLLAQQNMAAPSANPDPGGPGPGAGWPGQGPRPT